jgi:hypothetical protein
MNIEPHVIVFYAIAAVEVIVWLAALQFMLVVSRRPKPVREHDQEVLQLAGPVPATLLAGSAEIDGSPSELSVRAAAHLAKQGPLTLGAVKITEQTPDRLVFESMPGAVQMPGGGRLFTSGQMRFTSIGAKRTRVDYALEVPPRSWLLMLGWLFVGLGLLALAVAVCIVQLYVIGNANPALNWQSVQVVQAIHFLWPPFLFGGIYRRLRNHVRSTFEGMVHNLPYLEA